MKPSVDDSRTVVAHGRELQLPTITASDSEVTHNIKPLTSEASTEASKDVMKKKHVANSIGKSDEDIDGSSSYITSSQMSPEKHDVSSDKVIEIKALKCEIESLKKQLEEAEAKHEKYKKEMEEKLQQKVEECEKYKTELTQKEQEMKAEIEQLKKKREKLQKESDEKYEKLCQQ